MKSFFRFIKKPLIRSFLHGLSMFAYAVILGRILLAIPGFCDYWNAVEPSVAFCSGLIFCPLILFLYAFLKLSCAFLAAPVTAVINRLVPGE